MSQPASSEHPRPATPRPVDQQGTGDTTPVSLESSLPAPDIPTANPPAQNSLAIDPPDSSHSPTPPPATSHPPPAEPTPTPASPPAPTPRPPAYAPRSQAAVEQGVQLPSIEHSPLSPPPTYNRNAIRILPPRAVGGTETPALPPPRPPSYIAIIPPRSIMGVIDPEKDTFTPISGIYQLNAYGKFTGLDDDMRPIRYRKRKERCFGVFMLFCKISLGLVAVTLVGLVIWGVIRVTRRPHHREREGDHRWREGGGGVW